MKKNTQFSKTPLIIQIANEMLDMYEELECLRKENKELIEYKKKYVELLDESIGHNNKMMVGFLDLAVHRLQHN